MGIPAIRPYPMPTELDLPDNVAGWRPDPGRAVLLIHDMQRYFVDFLPAGQPPVTDLLANLGRLRRAAGVAGVPVIYTAQPGGMTAAERGLLRDMWGPGMPNEARQRGIVAELAPGPADVVLTKYRYSAFHRTPLAEVLAGAGRDQLVVAGVYAHLGCLITACDAFSRDVEAFLVADAVADFSRPEHVMALTFAARRCAVTLTTAGLIDALVHPDARLTGSGVACPGAGLAGPGSRPVAPAEPAEPAGPAEPAEPAGRAAPGAGGPTASAS
jgi:isochorismate hydrolase